MGENSARKSQHNFLDIYNKICADISEDNEANKEELIEFVSETFMTLLENEKAFCDKPERVKMCVKLAEEFKISENRRAIEKLLERKMSALDTLNDSNVKFIHHLLYYIYSSVKEKSGFIDEFWEIFVEKCQCKHEIKTDGFAEKIKSFNKNIKSGERDYKDECSRIVNLIENSGKDDTHHVKWLFLLSFFPFVRSRGKNVPKEHEKLYSLYSLMADLYTLSLNGFNNPDLDFITPPSSNGGKKSVDYRSSYDEQINDSELKKSIDLECVEKMLGEDYANVEIITKQPHSEEIQTKYGKQLKNIYEHTIILKINEESNDMKNDIFKTIERAEFGLKAIDHHFSETKDYSGIFLFEKIQLFLTLSKLYWLVLDYKKSEIYSAEAYNCYYYELVEKYQKRLKISLLECKILLNRAKIYNRKFMGAYSLANYEKIREIASDIEKSRCNSEENSDIIKVMLRKSLNNMTIVYRKMSYIDAACSCGMKNIAERKNLASLAVAEYNAAEAFRMAGKFEKAEELINSAYNKRSFGYRSQNRREISSLIRTALCYARILSHKVIAEFDISCCIGDTAGIFQKIEESFANKSLYDKFISAEMEVDFLFDFLSSIKRYVEPFNNIQKYFDDAESLLKEKYSENTVGAVSLIKSDMMEYNCNYACFLVHKAIVMKEYNSDSRYKLCIEKALECINKCIELYDPKLMNKSQKIYYAHFRLCLAYILNIRFRYEKSDELKNECEKNYKNVLEIIDEVDENIGEEYRNEEDNGNRINDRQYGGREQNLLYYRFEANFHYGAYLFETGSDDAARYLKNADKYIELLVEPFYDRNNIVTEEYRDYNKSAFGGKKEMLERYLRNNNDADKDKLIKERKFDFFFSYS